ncbi:MAG TPA: hypothetical protein VFH37_01320 [Candidatus Saccharimonadales bacterium]|nr:hypothetical protein [Candidatus Saccharimonadales bacterium]
MFRKAFCTFALIAMVFAAFAAAASATVYPQSPFTYTGFGGTYQGTCTTNITDNHFINTCHATLTAGAPVSQTTKLDGANLHGVISPSGQMTEVVTLSLAQ